MKLVYCMNCTYINNGISLTITLSDRRGKKHENSSSTQTTLKSHHPEERNKEPRRERSVERTVILMFIHVLSMLYTYHVHILTMVVLVAEISGRRLV